MSGHSDSMAALAPAGIDLFARRAPADADRSGARAIARPTLEAIYEAHFDFVWRSVRRLGAPEHAVDDAVQDVFLVAHRRLADFEGRSTIKTWLFGIALRVVKDYRRAAGRRGPTEPIRDSMVGSPSPGPMEELAASEAAEIVHRLLDTMDDDKRAVFVMAELEQMTAPEIAEATGANLNTVYARLRAARAVFEEGVRRVRARDEWRGR